MRGDEFHEIRAIISRISRSRQENHWSFGDMPPQPDVTATELANITRYVRELQRANGIE
jgi:hypothetical protein